MRVFDTCGPRRTVSDGRVVLNFIGQALSGAPLTIYGDGGQRRFFCFITDMVEGLVRLMASAGDMARACNRGNPRACTVLELVEVISAAVGTGTRILQGPQPQWRSDSAPAG
ncbi:hypothetical protein PSAL_002900 [Pseudooceanicola algae]|uniref:NAD-dependent epimerase/dehydratase domain-containing protein n=1 Tax=Pseudooceanicola algae TaxID=1537215 RepID=A0A418SKC8_9RHOB|nr:NAD-dependent epimerase/dehydratase family protein [Pseudooceanicola algae]QPM89080.1 hypothetical protein PSAL_002900 [Pseudooceanicola algae]